MKAVKSIVGAPFKAVAGVSKKILGGVKKAFKSLTSSTFGRALLIGATIYLGGAAFGMWNSPFTSINGAFTSQAAAEAGTASAASDAAAVAADAAPVAAETGAAAGTDAAAAGAGAADTTAANLSASSAVTPATESLGSIPASGNIADAATTYGGSSAAAPGSSFSYLGEPAKKGIIDSFMSNPLAQYGMIQAGAGALQGAFTPNAMDVAEKQAELDRQNLEWRNNFLKPNWQVGSLNLGMTPSGQPIRDANGNLVYPTQPGVPQIQPPQPVVPTGIINTAMRNR